MTTAPAGYRLSWAVEDLDEDAEAKAYTAADFGRTVMGEFWRRQREWLEVTVPESAGEQVRVAVLDLFDRQQRTVLARLTGTKARRGTRHWDPPGEKALDPRYVLDMERWERAVRESVVAPLLRTLLEGLALVQSRYGDEPRELTEAERATYVAPLVQRVVDLLAAKFQHLLELVSRMESEGADMAAIEAAVTEAYEQRDEWARSAAEEASLAAYNAGALQGALRSATDLRKVWVSMRDDRVRDSHREADGQSRRVSEPFLVGGAAMMHCGDPAAPIEEWIQCRCVMAFYAPREEDADRADPDDPTHE